MKTSKQDYSKICQELKEIEAMKAILSSKKRKLEATELYKGSQQLKKPPKSGMKEKKEAITLYFKPTKESLIASLISDIIIQAWEVIRKEKPIYSNNQAQISILSPTMNQSNISFIKVKGNWSDRLKAEMREYLKTHSLAETFIYCN